MQGEDKGLVLNRPVDPDFEAVGLRGDFVDHLHDRDGKPRAGHRRGGRPSSLGLLVLGNHLHLERFGRRQRLIGGLDGLAPANAGRDFVRNDPGRGLGQSQTATGGRQRKNNQKLSGERRQAAYSGFQA